MGAAAPEIVRLSNIVWGTRKGQLPTFSPAYFLISLLFVALGGAVTVAWGENHPLKCFYIGVSLPVIVSTGAKILKGK